MPQKKTMHGLPKSISCPQCGKKFCMVTNVLQHMNQPMSLCYSASLAEEGGTFCALDGAEVPDVADWQYDDEVLDMGIPPINTTSFHSDYSIAPSPSYESQQEQLMDTGTFIETYGGCVATFPGGETFMDQFKND
ncbi:hypothetical protein EDC04DRAFT_2600794 [Pisolithus marmoratus]|nr:hypothetical protein EDC04DRAFT_2600794 [Pisolithus marmoratus]